MDINPQLEASSVLADLLGLWYNGSMKKIPLTRGKFAIVDDEDFEWASQYKWNYPKTGTSPGHHISTKGSGIPQKRLW